MIQEKITGISGNIITTTGGRRVAIGNADHKIGDWVWVDGGCVFGHRVINNRVPYVPSSEEYIIEMFSGATDVYRIRDAKKAGLPIIAEYTAPADYFLDGNTETYIVYGKNKFSIMTFNDTTFIVTIRTLQDGTWTREDVTLPCSKTGSAIMARDAYYDGNGDLCWIILIWHLNGDADTDTIFYEYKNATLFTTTSYATTIQSLIAEERATSNAINTSNDTFTATYYNQTVNNVYTANPYTGNTVEFRWIMRPQINTINVPVVSYRLNSFNLHDKEVYFTISSRMTIELAYQQRTLNSTGTVISDWMDSVTEKIGSIGRDITHKISPSGTIITHEKEYATHTPVVRTNWAYKIVNIANHLNTEYGTDFSLSINITDSESGTTAIPDTTETYNGYTLTYPDNGNPIMLAKDDWSMNVDDIFYGYVNIYQPSFIAESGGNIILYDTSNNQLVVINKADKTYTVVHSDYIYNLQIPILKIKKDKIKAFLGAV